MTDLTIRCGFEFIYEAIQPTPMILLIEPRLDPSQRLVGEEFGVEPALAVRQYDDVHGNTVRRFDLPAGRTTVRHDSVVAVSSQPENAGAADEPVPVSQLSPELLRYLLPSRYCDSDRLMDFAFEKFGQVPQGLQRVQAICDWVHRHIQYRYGAGSAFTAASEVIAQGYGVCRDFAHAAIALSRCFNIPSRYVTGYVPDVAFQDNGSPMDFHAYFQVYVGHRWLTYDARFNAPRIGRIKIACGLDAVDGAFSTIFGAAQLAWFQVWAYQIDPAKVRLGDPIDLAQRLCGTPRLIHPPRVPSGAVEKTPAA